jgi:hypothetical protein
LESNQCDEIKSLTAYRSSPASTSSIVLDSGSTTHVFNSMRSLKPSHELPKIIRGVTGSVLAPTCVHPIFGEVKVVQNCPINLLSMRRLLDDGWKVKYDEQDDKFTIEKGHELIIFVKQEGLYRAVTEQVLTSTLEYGYTKQQHSRAMAVRRLHASLGHPGHKSFSRMLQEGLITDCPFTSKDISESEAILGKCRACVMGKLPPLYLKVISPKSLVNWFMQM